MLGGPARHRIRLRLEHLQGRSPHNYRLSKSCFPLIYTYSSHAHMFYRGIIWNVTDTMLVQVIQTRIWPVKAHVGAAYDRHRDTLLHWCHDLQQSTLPKRSAQNHVIRSELD